MEHSTDNKIFLAAEKLFAEKGFAATSTRDIAKNAGVNVSMISYYFGSKEKLFEEIQNVEATFWYTKDSSFSRLWFSYRKA